MDLEHKRITLLALSCKGGMLHYTSQLANALSLHAQVSVVLPEGTPRDLFSENVVTREVRTSTSRLGYVMMSLNVANFVRIIRCIKTTHPEILHVVTSHPWNWIAAFFARSLPLICTIHDPKKHLGEFILSLYLTDQLLMRLSRAILVHGDFWRQYLANKGFPSTRIISIPIGGFTFFSQWTQAGKNEQAGNVVLFFGRIAQYKGLDILCQAEPLISKEVANLQIIIAGQGDTSLFTGYIEHPDHFLIINRYIADNDVPELFERCSLVVLPYLDASQTAVVPIAYAFQKPVVVTRVGALPECVDEGVTGLIVPPNDPLGLAQAVVEILKNQQTPRQMGKAGFEKMQRDMSWSAIALRILKAYGDAMRDFQSA